ncbi:MAG: HK97 family phage prohead protease [Bacteroidaceae bacterium]|nr:HK97 family phage prohead protease [Bacteroidaceae bacterium]
MAKKIDKRFVLTDNSLNSYGYRVITSGGRLERFKKNPVMLWMHFRDEGNQYWGESKPIGHWEDIEVTDESITAVPVFDCVDDLSKLVCAKVEAGTISATSIGLVVISTSKNEKDLLPGQTRESVTEWELMEASFVDIPANANAVRLYGPSDNVLALSLKNDVNYIPSLPTSNPQKQPMKLKETLSAVLAFLGIPKDKAQETELTDEQLLSLDGEMARLRSELETKTTELASKTKELSDVIASHATALASKDSEIASLKTSESALKQQVENLKKSAVPSPDLNPAGDPADETLSDVDKFLQAAANTDDYASIIAGADKLGMLD